MNRGLVSIIIPVYNRADFLAECLSSIREQTWKDLDVIVVDDGSTDGSREIVREYVEKDARFRLFSIAHQGPSAARNRGMKEARGEFLTFVDADDYVERDYIGNMVAAIGDADLCISGYQRWYQERNTWQTIKPASGRFTLAELEKRISRYECVMCGVAWKLLRRSVVAEHEIIFPPELRYAEDTVFFFEYLSWTETIVVLSDAQYVYRQHSHQSLVKASYQNITLIEQFSAELEKLYGKAQRDSLRDLIAYWQVVNLFEIGRAVCYGTKGVQKRKKQFYEIVRRYDMKQKCRRVKRGSINGTAVKLTVLSHTFIPFYLFVRALGRFMHLEEHFSQTIN